jgi:WD40 repeat protein/V8-like Glu-specific endopeptidase
VARATAAVFADGRRTGSAVLVASRYLVTAAHVLQRQDPRTLAKLAVKQVELAFPDQGLGAEPGRAAAARVDLGPASASVDVAVLDLGEDLPSWLPAPVPVWPAARLPGRVQVFGYPLAEGALNGVWRQFTVAGPATAGAVQLDWSGDAGTFPGHSGGPVIDAAGHALAGILVEGAERGRFDRFVPVTLIARAWPGLPRPWLMAGAEPGEARSHFTRRARGQRSAARGGDLFRGRAAALDRIGEWLTAVQAPGEPLVITGQPGAGKSAVLARAALGVEAGQGGPGLAFHARAATIGDFLTALADLTGIDTPASADELITSLAGLPGQSPVPVAVDALDEAASDRDRRQITEVLAELAVLPGLRVAVATRTMAAGSPFAQSGLLPALGVTARDDHNLIDLDSDTYFDLEDLGQFAAALLSQEGMEYPGPPGAAWTLYRARHSLRDRLAAALAERAGRNFLVAALAAVPLSTARTMIDPAVEGFDAAWIPSEVGEALDKYLQQLPEPRRASERGLLTALAYARGSGLDDRRWLAFASALGYPAKVADLDAMRHSPTADYLLQTTPIEPGTRPLTRLFHQALADEFLTMRHQPGDESALLDRLLDEAIRTSWADTYLQEHVAEHAAAAGRLDDVLTDPQSLTASDPHRLLTLLGQAGSDLAVSVAAIYRRSASALIGRSCRERASILEFTARQQDATRVAERLAAAFPDRPWVSRWARWTQVPEHLVLANGLVKTVGLAVIRLPAGVRVVVAEAQGTVRGLDLETGQVLWTVRLDAPKCLSAAADIVAVGTESEIVLLDATTGSARQMVAWAGGEVKTIALSPEASLLAAGNYSLEADPAIVCVWERSADGSGFTQLWSAPAFEMGILSLSWRSSIMRTQLVVGGDPYRQPKTDWNLARVFDGAAGTLIASLPARETAPATARVSPSGRIVTLQGWNNKYLTWWKTDNSEPEQTVVTAIDGSMNTIVWDFDSQLGTEAVIGATGECVCRIEMSRDAQPTVLAHEPGIQALTVADGLLITVNRTGALTRWDLNQMSRLTARRENISRAWSTQAGSLIFSTSGDEPGVVRVEDVATGYEVRRESFPPLDSYDWTAVTVADEHDLLLVGDRSGRVHGWRSSEVTEEVFVWQIHQKPEDRANGVNSIALHEDLLVTAGEDGAVRFTNWRTGKQALAPVAHYRDEPGMHAIVVTDPSGEAVILAGNRFGMLLSWQLSSLSPKALFSDGFSGARVTELTEADRDLDVSLLKWLRQPNGSGWVAVPSWSGHIQIFDIAARTEYRWRAHDCRIVAICDSGDLLYSADDRGLVRCWANVRERTPRLLSELATNSRIITLLPLVTENIAIVSANGLAVVRCDA